MTIDNEVLNNYLNIFSIILCTLSAIFLLILLNPLYKFSKERTALFILFSKSCANILYQFRQIYVCIYRYFPFSQSYWSYFFVQPSALLLINAAYFHVIMLALNRFHAVLFPFNYQKWWKKKNIKYFILITWVINIVWSTLQYIAIKYGIYIVDHGIFMYGDLPLVLTICISTSLYSVVLSKFIYDYSKLFLNFGIYLRTSF